MSERFGQGSGQGEAGAPARGADLLLQIVDSAGASARAGGLLLEIIDRAGVAMALIDRNDCLSFVNAAFVRLFGCDLSGRGFAAIVHPEDHGGLPSDGAGEDRVERRYLRSDGAVFYGLTTVSPLEAGPDGRPFRAVLQIVDIDERKAAETRLAQSEWRWNHALLGARQGIWDADLSADRIWVSPQIQAMLGLAERQCEVSEAEWAERIHPDDRPAVLAMAGEAITGRIAGMDSTYRVRHADGRWIWILSRGKAVTDPQSGKPRRLVGTVTNVTDEREMEERLAAVSERLDVALEASGIGLFAIDFAADRLHWDRRTHELHDVAPETFGGSLDEFRKILHPEDAERLARLREDAALGRQSRERIDYRIADRDGTVVRHIRTSFRLSRTEDGRLLRALGACWDITEDVERDRHSRDTLALLEAVMNGTPDLIYVKDLAGRYLIVNRSVEKVMGRPRVVGLDDGQIFAPDTAAAIQANDRDVLASGRPLTMVETAVVDGELRQYSSTKAPRRGRGGEITGLIGISRDITEMKAAEAALRHSELRWQFALDGSGDGIWDWNTVTGEVFYSRRWKAMLGYDEHEVGSALTEWSERVHPDDLPQCWEAIQGHFSGATPDFSAEYRMRAKGGAWRWIHDRGRIIERAPDGTPTRLIGTHTDITSRKESESALLALNQRLQLALGAAGAGIFEFDFAARRCRWDERMHELHGIPPGSYDGRRSTWLSFTHPDDLARVHQVYDAAFKEGDLFSMDVRIRLPRSGELRHIRSLARIMRDEKGEPLRAVGINWDITDHQELAEALFEEKERLRITLHSIGDSVISTDADTRITFMNPVAEAMTGWPAMEAVGKPLSEVFRIVDEKSGEPIADPVETCLRQLRPFYLNDGAVLLARDGERRSIRDSAAPVRTATGEVIGAVLVFQDVTKARSMQQALEHSANHDSLTGLPNRAAFERALREAGDAARRGVEHVLCFIDLDRFKIVNDSAGHAAGDALLREVANLLRRLCRAEDLPARLGGDEFALLLRERSLAEGEAIGQRFIDSVAGLRFTWDDRSYQIGASMGLTRVGPGATRPDELMTEADIACYTAKSSGRNRLAVYGGVGSAAGRNHREMQVAAGIRNAIETHRFRLFGQEVRSFDTARAPARHFEILLRMVDASGHIAEPAAFIPASERYDLMGNIDRWVIRSVFQNYGARLRAAEGTTVAINLSANSLNDPFLWPFLQEQFASSGVPPGLIDFEITETAVINNLSAAKQFLSKARAAGCGVILDDFGTGLSSFTYLRQFPVSGLKIDGGFIRQMHDSEIDRAIVESINAIGHRLGAVTVAEQVEDVVTLDMVRAMGIDRAQGFVIGHPRPLDSLL